jgi:hypothetical protein
MRCCGLRDGDLVADDLIAVGLIADMDTGFAALHQQHSVLATA